MSMNHRSRSLVFGIATAFALTILAPVAVNAEEETAALAPVAAPSVDETSDDEVRAISALAAERALLSGEIGSTQEEHLLAIVAAAPTWDDTSGYGSLENSRAAASALFASVAAPSWDETSGYGTVEASRATIGHQATNTTQVPADVRWAPVPAVSLASSVEASRVLAAQQALHSEDLGSLQEDALSAVVEASVSDAPAPTSAELLKQFRATELSLSRYLGAD
jgi:hypothetical protein